jgi:hypothetical protein
MKSSILIMALVLAGCCTNPIIPTEPKIVKEVSYVVRIPPKESLELPAAIPKVDVSKATQADAANFILSQAEQITTLTNKLINIAKFLSEEQAKLDLKARDENAANKKEALKN